MSEDGPVETSVVASLVQSSGSDNDSGSESDDESSDIDGQSSEDEEHEVEQVRQGVAERSRESVAAKHSTSSAPSLAGEDTVLFHGEGSIGFLEDTDFMAQLRGDGGKTDEERRGERRDSMASLEGGRQWFDQAMVFNSLPASEDPIPAPPSTQTQEDGGLSEPRHSFTHSSTTHTSVPPLPPGLLDSSAHPPLATGGGDTAAPAGEPSADVPIPIAAAQSILSRQDSVIGISGRKRKLDRQSSFPGRLRVPSQKAPRLAPSAIHPRLRRESSLSSFSVSSESSSGSSDSSDDEGDESSAFAPQSFHRLPLSSSAPVSLAPSSSSSSSFQPVTSHSPTVSSLQAPQDPISVPGGALPPGPPHSAVVRPQHQLEAGELEEEEEGEEEEGEEKEEGEREEVGSLLVRIPLHKVVLSRERKPKACFSASSSSFSSPPLLPRLPPLSPLPPLPPPLPPLPPPLPPLPPFQLSQC